jgi:hypothetical protein
MITVRTLNQAALNRTVKNYIKLFNNPEKEIDKWYNFGKIPACLLCKVNGLIAKHGIDNTYNKKCVHCPFYINTDDDRYADLPCINADDTHSFTDMYSTLPYYKESRLPRQLKIAIYNRLCFLKERALLNNYEFNFDLTNLKKFKKENE